MIIYEKCKYFNKNMHVNVDMLSKPNFQNFKFILIHFRLKGRNSIFSISFDLLSHHRKYQYQIRPDKNFVVTSLKYFSMLFECRITIQQSNLIPNCKNSISIPLIWIFHDFFENLWVWEFTLDRHIIITKSHVLIWITKQTTKQVAYNNNNNNIHVNLKFNELLLCKDALLNSSSQPADSSYLTWQKKCKSIENDFHMTYDPIKNWFWNQEFLFLCQ